MNNKGPSYTILDSIGQLVHASLEDVHYDGHTLPLLPCRIAPSPGMERGRGMMGHAGGLIVGEWPLYITNPFSVSHE